MELNPCLISNPTVVNKSKKVLIFAEKIAKEYNLLVSDLILAAVWHCLNQTKQINNSADNKKTYKENNSQKVSIDKDCEEGLQNEDRVSSEQSGYSSAEEQKDGPDATETKHVTSIHRLPTDVEEKKEQLNKKLGDTITKENVQSELNVEPEIRIDNNLNKQQGSQVAKNSYDATGGQEKNCVSEPKCCPFNSQENIHDLKKGEFCSKTSGGAELLAAKSDSNLQKCSDKSIKTQSQTTSKNTNGQVNQPECGSVNKVQTQGALNEVYLHAVQNTTQLKSFVEGSRSDKTLKESEKKQVVAADVEIISIDDDDDDNDDSNEAIDGSNEGTVAQIETVVNEDLIEEKEPEYFDMDCDEIDDEAEYEEMFDTSMDLAVRERSPKTQIKGDTNMKNNGNMKDADITIISDDEDDCEVKENRPSVKAVSGLLKKPSTSSCNSQTEQEGKRSRRKQSHINIKVDIPESVEKKVKENVVKESTEFTCPVMEHMEDMSLSKQVSSIKQADNKNSTASQGNDNDASQLSSPAAMLGLVHVSSPKKMTENVEEPKAVHIVSSLASNQSIYVSSGMMHGCIPCLPPVQDLQPVNAPSSSFANVDPTPLQDLSCFDPVLQKSALYSQPEILSVQSLDSDVKSPPRKKRLLDYDKKWHMEPKYSPEQDKYLALPGGVEANSVLTDWRQPGKYASISQILSSPSIGIETVDSDYMNYQSLNVESYLDDDDNDYEGSDDDDDDDDASDNSDADYRRKIGRKSVTRGRGRGRPRGVRSTIRVTRGTSQRTRDMGRGFTRGPKYTSDRGARRCSVKGVRGRPRGRPALRGSVGTRRGMRTRGAAPKMFTLKTKQRDDSPTKLSSFLKGSGSTSRGRKIGFYSLKLGKPNKLTNDKWGSQGGVRRGRGRPSKRALHNMVRTRSSTGADGQDASSSAGQTRKRGQKSSRGSRGIGSSRGSRGIGSSRGFRGIGRRARAASKPPEDSVKQEKEEKLEDVIVID